MPITWDSLQEALNDELMGRFKQLVGSADGMFVSLSTAALPILDADFRLDGNDPNSPYVVAKARDWVARVNNHCCQFDGANRATLMMDRIDDVLEFQVVDPSEPWTPPNTGPNDVLSLENTFAAVKAETQKRLETSKMAAADGTPTTLRICQTSPDRWFDATQTAAWVSFSKELKEAAPPGPPQTTQPVPPVHTLPDLPPHPVFPIGRHSPPPPLLSFKPSNEDIIEHLKPLPEKPDFESPLRRQVLMMPQSGLRTKLLTAAEPHTSIGSHSVTALSVEPDSPVIKAKPFQLHTQLLKEGNVLPIEDRIFLRSSLVDTAPKADSTTPFLTISFDFMIVVLDRPWFFLPYIQNRNWYVPATKAGEFAGGTQGKGKLSAVQTAMLIIKNLSIRGQWSDSDRSQLGNIDQFGPFHVTQAASSLAWSGMQLIGWICQVMPTLPPASGPA
ncbi:MAG TPA: hypothetical protein VHE55_04625 [Fimbriimonadaceae bacterium]|nr:hypothetical protein [Fimbriimonadaceae bacterium]